MQFDLFDDTQNSIFASKHYSLFRDSLVASDCKRCGLYQGRRNIVIDRGNPSSRVMIIGEAPGEKEDATGRAFVGKAGKLLDEIMKSISLDTERDLLIANVVKCRPPENRSPRRDEVHACIPYLHKQIELVHPAVILLLGAVALKHMIPEKGAFAMAGEAGKLFQTNRYPGVDFMVLYHPAYLLYDPRKKKDMWKHVKHLSRFMRETSIQ